MKSGKPIYNDEWLYLVPELSKRMLADSLQNQLVAGSYHQMMTVSIPKFDPEEQDSDPYEDKMLGWDKNQQNICHPHIVYPHEDFVVI
jgi:hypothetical protein